RRAAEAAPGGRHGPVFLGTDQILWHAAQSAYVISDCREGERDGRRADTCETVERTYSSSIVSASSMRASTRIGST
ncbi:unnamed protein product, partial [Nesidiocoris tenuis]